MSPLVLWALTTLAAYRVWRLLALDDLPGLADVRDRLIDRANGTRAERWVDGLGCAWCLGFWTCLAAFVAVDLAGASVPLPAVQVAAASTVVGLIGANVDG